MRIVFAGTPGFAVPSLHAAMGKGDVVAVYTQPDRPAAGLFFVCPPLPDSENRSATFM